MSQNGSIGIVFLIVAWILAATNAAADSPQPNPTLPQASPIPGNTPAATKPPGKMKAAPPSVTVIEPADAHGVLGRDVRSTSGQDMGRIVDVIVDRGGAVRAAVIDFGGFLGVGSRKIVVDWDALHFGHVENKNDSITLDLTQDQVKAAPEYKEGTPVVVLGASGTLQPLRFGQ